MIITFATILNIVLFSSIAILLLNFIISKNKIILEIGTHTMLICMIMILFRLFFPFELSLHNSIYITRIWPDVYVRIVRPTFSFAGIEWSIWFILIAVSVTGSCLFLVRLIVSYIKIMSVITTYEKINKIEIIQLVNAINASHKKQRNFNLVMSRSAISPFAFGLFKPYIVLPDMNFSKNDLEHILRHEMMHHYSKDLWIRFICELICALYWWNPFSYLLRSQINRIQELHIDLEIMNNLNESQKLEYVECLIDFTKHYSSKHKERLLTAFNHNSGNTMLNRFKTIVDYLDKPNQKSRQTLRSTLLTFALVISIFVLPNFIILEAKALPENIEELEGTFSINQGNSFFILNDDGTYDLYLGGQYLITVTEAFDDSLKIYSSDGEELR